MTDTGEESPTASKPPPKADDIWRVKLKQGILEAKRRSRERYNRQGISTLTLILGKEGRLVGYSQFIPDKGKVDDAVIVFGGTLDIENNSVKFTHQLHGRCIYAEGKVRILQEQPIQIFRLHIEEKIARTVVSQSSDKEKVEFVSEGSYQFQHVAQPLVVQHYVIGPGLVQMDGELLSVQMKQRGDIAGWLIWEPDSSISKTTGVISMGSWDAEDSTLSFGVDFYDKSSSAAFPAISYRWIGAVSNCGTAIGAGAPVFKGVITMLDSKNNNQYECLRLEVEEILGVGGCIEYGNFVVPSSPFVFSSASFDLFTRTINKNYRTGYAGPGLYKVRTYIKSSDRGINDSYYLAETDHKRNDCSRWVGWRTGIERASVWRIFEPRENRGLVIAISDQSGTETDKYLSCHLQENQVKDPNRNLFEERLMFHDGGEYHGGLFDLEHYREKLIVYISGAMAETGWHFPPRLAISAPVDLARNEHHLDDFTFAAMLLEDWDKTTDISLLCLSN